MKAWSHPGLPQFAANPGEVLLHDTLSDALVSVPAGKRTARLYVCGITPYDATHIGHANTYVAFDLLNRTWLDAGIEVHYTQNVTDVDDPLLERAAATNVDWHELATEQIELFRTDMAALRVIPPENYIGAVESIPQVIALIERLDAKGHIYRVPDPEYPDWYFRAGRALEADGDIDLNTALAVFGERGGDPDRPGKEHPLDTLVWRMARPGEPTWDGSLGVGRPGWHVECTAIALDTVGECFDVQAGGSDLVFPHHTMCAITGSAATGMPFAGVHAHSGMVAYQGEKMSKSLGNLVFVSRLREQGVDPMVIRLALMAHHYRSDWEWTDADLERAEERLNLWRRAVTRIEGISATDTVAQVRRALRNDLNTPVALAAIDTWAHASGTMFGDDTDSPDTIRSLVDALLGVRLVR